jgi:2-dehydropantoate 2-reductase
MHIILAGPGALGCLLASILIKGNRNGADTISLLDYNKDRAARVSTNGIVYQKDNNELYYGIKVYSEPRQIDHADVLFLCVKSYDVKETLRFCAPLLSADTLLIYMQNGMAHLKHDAYSGKAAPLFGTTTEGATRLGPGYVRHAGIGDTYFGFLHPQKKRPHSLLKTVINRLTAGGMEVHLSESIYRRLWAKLFINVGINALTAIHDCKNGALLTIPKARQQMAGAIAEAEEVARAEGVTISDPLQSTIDVCRSTSENISSMLQDIRQKRKTEIDAINGAIIEMAAQHHIATPVNTLLLNQVKELHSKVSASF